jgi:hypothetical protein
MVVVGAGEFLRRTRALAPLLLTAACTGPSLDWQGRPDVPLADYQQAFAHAVGERFDAEATPDEILDRAAAARVLWLGDHHRDLLLHDRQRDLLVQLQRRGKPWALGLEAIGMQDEPRLRDYLAGRISLDQFTRAVGERWPDSWLEGDAVDAPHYRSLLRLCAASGVPVFALEPTPRLPLARRDDEIAGAVRAAADRWPGRLLVVVIGQTHLCGGGDLIGRVGLPSVALGAHAPEALAAAVPRACPAGRLLRSDGGLWFFADLMRE